MSAAACVSLLLLALGLIPALYRPLRSSDIQRIQTSLSYWWMAKMQRGVLISSCSIIISEWLFHYPWHGVEMKWYSSHTWEAALYDNYGCGWKYNDLIFEAPKCQIRNTHRHVLPRLSEVLLDQVKIIFSFFFNQIKQTLFIINKSCFIISCPMN